MTPRVLQALSEFSTGPDLSARAKALSELLTERALSKVVDTADFWRGFDALTSEARGNSSPESTLVAIAQLVRLAQSHPPLSSRVTAAISPALEATLPAASLLASGSDRAYVAKAVAGVKGDWVARYAAVAIAEESTAERTRAEFMQVLFDNAPSVAAVLGALHDALTSVEMGTEKPAESLYKRVTRILAAFRTVLATSRLGPGTTSGKALHLLVATQIERYGSDVCAEVSRDLISEVIWATHQLVRSRFSLATDADTYAALKQVKAKLAARAWPVGTEEDRALVSETIQEAILLLGKQEITSPSLRYLLELIVGVEASDRALACMAECNPELPEPIRAWLARRPVPKGSYNSEAARRQEHLDSDHLVGECLLARSQLLRTRTNVYENLMAALEIYDPVLASALQKLGGDIMRVTEEVESLAKARSLALLSAVGEEILLSRKYFDVVNDPPRERMTVERPAVIRLLADGSPGAAVIKGVLK